jgi:GNAT superfamily N-acetyltransferase
MQTQVIITHLEVTSRSDFRPVDPNPDAPTVTVIRVETPLPELNRFFYATVGRGWFWLDRLGWSRARWMEYLFRPGVETWIGYLQGTPVGYFELEAQSGGSVEIVYFGLLPQFVGRGFGRSFLSAAVERAWGTGASRVWVHTCSLDHPRALTNYEALGFRVFKTEGKIENLPDSPPELWPGEMG